MGLFSNLFGNDGKDIDSALSKMKNLAEDIMDDGQINSQPGQQSKPYAPPAGTAEPLNTRRPEPEAVAVDGPSGDSWGPVMPAEENQFNSGLKYSDYFTGIFEKEFSAYSIDKQSLRDGKAMLYTFSRDGVKKLVVEVISDRSNPYKYRKDCRTQGIAYLRYYYDHDGWWNTKSYVTRRTANALGQ